MKSTGEVHAEMKLPGLAWLELSVDTPHPVRR